MLAHADRASGFAGVRQRDAKTFVHFMRRLVDAERGALATRAKIERVAERNRHDTRFLRIGDARVAEELDALVAIVRQHAQVTGRQILGRRETDLADDGSAGYRDVALGRHRLVREPRAAALGDPATLAIELARRVERNLRDARVG